MSSSNNVTADAMDGRRESECGSALRAASHCIREEKKDGRNGLRLEE